MKKIILAVFLVFILTGISFGQSIGPATPAPNKEGRVASPNIGIGYSFIQSEWKPDDSGGFKTDWEQNQIYLHLGAVFGDSVYRPNYEIFARIGLTDIEVDNGLVLFTDSGIQSQTFEGDTEPMYAFGMKGEFYQGYIVGIGGVIQASYIDSYNDGATFTYADDNYTFNADIEDIWDVELAFPVQAKINNGIFYAGPLFYSTTAKVIGSISDGITTVAGSADLEENHNVGAFGGFAFRSQNFSLELEGKYKSDFSVGAFASVAF